MNRRNWRESPSGVSHGFIIERTILTKQDDSKPGREGAFLLNMESFARGYIEGAVTTVPESHERVQEVFYVVRGRGEFDGGGVKRHIGEGDAIMVPAGVEHVLRNLAEEPLEVLTVREELPEGVEPKTRQPVIRNYREFPLSQGHWVYLGRRLLDARDGLTSITGVFMVTIEPMQTGDSHAHAPGTDELWYTLEGSAVHVVGQEMCVQTEGDVVGPPPGVEHSQINHTDKPFRAFLFSWSEAQARMLGAITESRAGG